MGVISVLGDTTGAAGAGTGAGLAKGGDATGAGCAMAGAGAGLSAGAADCAHAPCAISTPAQASVAANCRTFQPRPPNSLFTIITVSELYSFFAFYLHPSRAK